MRGLRGVGIGRFAAFLRYHIIGAMRVEDELR